jgi:hypothetical protein
VNNQLSKREKTLKCLEEMVWCGVVGVVVGGGGGIGLVEVCVMWRNLFLSNRKLG